MDYDAIRRAPSKHSSAEVLRVYDVCGSIVTDLAREIRGRGYAARAHTLRFEQINMLPHAVAAGLGELGKHGSLINRELGCSFRLAAVTTDLPLAADAPKPSGVAEFCLGCSMCVRYCPGDAISDEQATVRGSKRWLVDTEACAPYWGTYFACGVCLQVCPLNAQSLDGRYRDTFVQTIKEIDLPRWRAELRAGLQEPWSLVERPADFSAGWRMQVQGKGAGAAILRGVPRDGVVRPPPGEAQERHPPA